MNRSIFNTCCVILLICGSSQAEVVYDSIPSPEPGNLPSLGYQATSTDEFGDHIILGGSNRTLTNVTIGMSNWALKSNYMDGNDVPLPAFGHVTMDANGYEHDLTVNLYSVDTSGIDPALGSLLATKTVTAFVPWRPEPFAFNGILFKVDVDFTSDNLVLPNEIIASVAYNTNTHGYSPIGLAGPYESLNYALASNPAEPTIGSDAEVDAVFWNTSQGPFYADGGAGGVNIFRRDTVWTPYTPALEINAVPEPASLALCGLSAMGLTLFRPRRK